MKLKILAFFLFFGFLSSHVAHGLMMTRLSDEQMVGNTEIACLFEMLDTKTGYDDNSFLYTEDTYKCLKVIKGAKEGDVIPSKFIGKRGGRGVVGGAGIPRVKQGDQFVGFLSPASRLGFRSFVNFYIYRVVDEGRVVERPESSVITDSGSESKVEDNEKQISNAPAIKHSLRAVPQEDFLNRFRTLHQLQLKKQKGTK